MEGAVLSYAPSEHIDMGLFVFKGEHRQVNARRRQWDGELALEFTPRDSFRLGAGFLTDLAEVDDGPLEGNTRYERRVAGWVAFGEWEVGPVVATAEIVRSLKAFAELDEESNRPSAWNLELAWQVADPLVAAARFEGSSRLDEEPRRRAGLALIWGVRRNVTLAVEFLGGRYAPGLLEDADEHEIVRVNRLGTQLSVTF